MKKNVIVNVGQGLSLSIRDKHANILDLATTRKKLNMARLNPKTYI